jgi:hypothetical protein
MFEYAQSRPCADSECPMSTPNITRFDTNPLISPFAGPGIEVNINGPSVIRAPAWLPAPLGRYYLYFADHKGPSIRLAFADDIRGPWHIHPPGTLQLAASLFLTQPAEVPPLDQLDQTRLNRPVREGVPTPIDSATKPHIASPDVHVVHARKEIVMYYHGLSSFGKQTTRVATSRDGVEFACLEPELERTYLRAFEHDEMWYAMAMPGVFYRSKDGLGGFEQGPQLFPNTMRHSALLKRENTLHVFWSRVGDTPEHILMSTIDVAQDWQQWQASDPVSVMSPEQGYEGADQPLVASVRDAINIRVNQLRDPAIFEEDGRTYLFYSIAGEAGIAGAELEFDESAD